jgi:hypothetical protein
MELCTSPIRELDPLIAKTLALRVALCLAVEKGFSRLIFEVDCDEVVRYWLGRLQDRSVNKTVLEEIGVLGLSFVF